MKKNSPCFAHNVPQDSICPSPLSGNDLHCYTCMLCKSSARSLEKKYLWKFSIFKQKSVTYFDLVLFSGNEGLKWPFLQAIFKY